MHAVEVIVQRLDVGSNNKHEWDAWVIDWAEGPQKPRAVDGLARLCATEDEKVKVRFEL